MEGVPQDPRDDVRVPGAAVPGVNAPPDELPADLPEAQLLVAEPAHEGHHALLMRLGHDAVALPAEPVGRRAVGLQPAPLVMQGSAGPFSNGFPFLLRHGAQDVHQQLACGGRGVQALVDRYSCVRPDLQEGAAEALERTLAASTGMLPDSAVAAGPVVGGGTAEARV